MEKGRDLLFYEDRDSTSKQAVVEFDPRLIGTSNSGDQNPVMTSCVDDLGELSLLYGKIVNWSQCCIFQSVGVRKLTSEYRMSCTYDVIGEPLSRRYNFYVLLSKEETALLRDAAICTSDERNLTSGFRR